MATSAVAQATVFALRQKIAKIEGVLPETLAAPALPGEDGAGIVLRRQGLPARPALSTGSLRLDAAIGSSLSEGLIEIHGAATRDAGAVAGFTLALAGIAAASRPLLWVGTSEIFREAGRPYALGLAERFGILPEQLLVAEAEKLSDVLWIAEEAASLKSFAAIILEIRGSPRLLDLTATRRLHRRALGAHHPLFLMRQAGNPEPTAAPVRLNIAATAAGLRVTLGGPLEGSIGPPAMMVAVDKTRTSARTSFTLEWNRDARAFEEKDYDFATRDFTPQDIGSVAAASADGADLPPSSRAVLAFRSVAADAAFGDQPSAGKQPAHLFPRRAG